MEQWEKNYYISSVAGAANGSSLVVMSKGWSSNDALMFDEIKNFHGKSGFSHMQTGGGRQSRLSYIVN